MTPMTERISRALAFGQSEMPTGSDQQALANCVETMRMEGESERTIVRAIVAAVYDGLAYGNWPAE